MPKAVDEAGSQPSIRAGRRAKPNVTKSAASASSRRSVPVAMDGYHALVRAFPLVPIRDADHLAAAAAFIDGLLRRDLDTGELEYLDVLSDLVEGYEAAHHAMPDASGADVLKELMRANGLTQQGLSDQVGIPQSTISALLSGVRKFNVRHVHAFAKRFNVPPATFLPESP